MSFTDDENKRIEDEALKAEQEVRERLSSMFLIKEPEEESRGKDSALSADPVSEKRSSGRVVKKVNVDVDENEEIMKQVRISKPGYSLSGHKILTDSNYQEEFREDPKVARETGQKEVGGIVQSDTRKVGQSESQDSGKKPSRKIEFKDTREILKKDDRTEKRKSTKKKSGRDNSKETRKDVRKEVRKDDRKDITKDTGKNTVKESVKDTVKDTRRDEPEKKRRIIRKENGKSLEKDTRKGGAAGTKDTRKAIPADRISERLREEPDRRYREIPDPEPIRYSDDIPESFYVAPGILWFRQDLIPSAPNDLTKGVVINSTRKVTKRERKVERAADTGTRETVRRAQVSVFSPEFRTESPLTDRQLSAYARDTRQKPSRSRQQSRLLSIDNSKKKRKERLKHGKVAGPGGKIAVLILVLLAIAICIFGYTTARKVFDDAAMDPNDLSKIEYTVYDGTTDDEVGEFLESHGMVESTLMYKLRAKIFDAEYVAGTYELSPSYSTEKIINILSGFDYSSGN